MRRMAWAKNSTVASQLHPLPGQQPTNRNPNCCWFAMLGWCTTTLANLSTLERLNRGEIYCWRCWDCYLLRELHSRKDPMWVVQLNTVSKKERMIRWRFLLMVELFGFRAFYHHHAFCFYLRDSHRMIFHPRRPMHLQRYATITVTDRSQRSLRKKK